MSQSTSPSIFATIPPERLGVRGEYDHDGLAKRVQLALEQQFNYHEIAHLKVSQRGTVVILIGEVPHRRIFNQLIAVAMNVHGAAAVEINGRSIFSLPHVSCSESHYPFLSSFAC